ncbi:MAG: YebC/PmpR family DNA-binding transcriptional regulator [Verrucomicrobiales bacterium]|nr:YebC/PmpR family DNA-binding transcriptional regulator [Verrucomicrobiales bacterium]MCP5525776.1 YebC/PmpR family DNA-binding transcriptional regulator [Verrucomicrobiales bacterium]
MGAQWKQTHREAAALKKGQLVGKLVREIMVAAKLGGADPELNPRLFAALEKARKNSVTRDTIERAVKKGSGQSDDATVIELVTYEGFAPHQVPVIVECLTDSRNRTGPEMRRLFRAGSIGSPGSVAWMFDHLGMIEAHHADGGIDLESAAIEAGAQNVEAWADEEVPEERTGARFYTERTELDAVAKALTQSGWTMVTSELAYLIKNPVELADDQRTEVAAFLNDLDDHDDVHRIYAGLK